MPKVDIGDAEIHYEEAGSGPPLMLVPGLGGNGSFWARQMEAFKGDFRTIIHDHRGAGQSTHSPIRYSVDQMATDVLKLMDALDIDRAHFVGHSTGGAIGQTIAQDHPDRLKALGLSATWAGSDPFFRRSFELRKALLETFGLERYSEMTALVLNPPFWVAENDETISAGAKAALANAAPVEIMISRIDGIMAFDRRARMGEIAHADPDHRRPRRHGDADSHDRGAFGRHPARGNGGAGARRPFRAHRAAGGLQPAGAGVPEEAPRPLSRKGDFP